MYLYVSICASIYIYIIYIVSNMCVVLYMWRLHAGVKGRSSSNTGRGGVPVGTSSEAE